MHIYLTKFFVRLADELTSANSTHFTLDKWKCGVLHKWLGFVQFGLVLLGLVLGFAFIITRGIERIRKGEIELLNKDTKAIGRV